jgi:hypothetical protein
LDAFATSHGDQAELQAEVLALRRQAQVLERQIKRVHWSPGDRMVLAALRERISEIRLGWNAGEARDSARLAPRASADEMGSLSRPTAPWPAPISPECRQLIVRIARENPGWGYFRIRGELLKLGHQVAATTIRSVLLAAEVRRSGRRSQLTRKQFLTAHAEPLVAADFFSVDTIFFRHVRPYLSASGVASSLAGELHLGTECCLGHPTSP